MKWDSMQQVVEASEGDDESSQFAELKAIRLTLQIVERKSGQSIVTHGWWLIPCGGGYGSRRPAGRAEVNSSGLLYCGKTLLPRWKTSFYRIVMEMLACPKATPLKNIKTVNR